MCSESRNLFNHAISTNGVYLLCLSYLVAQSLRRNDGNLIADALVGLKVEGEFWVVAFDDDLCGLLDGFCADATHVGGFDVSVEVVGCLGRFFFGGVIKCGLC